MRKDYKQTPENVLRPEDLDDAASPTQKELYAHLSAPSAAPQGTSAALKPAKWFELITEQDVAEVYQSAPNWHSVLSSLQYRAIKKYQEAIPRFPEPAPVEASDRERARKWLETKFPVGNLGFWNWQDVDSLASELAAAYRRGQEVFVEALDHTHGWCLEVPEGHTEQRIIGCWCGEKLDGLEEFNAHLLRALPVGEESSGKNS